LASSFRKAGFFPGEYRWVKFPGGLEFFTILLGFWGIEALKIIRNFGYEDGEEVYWGIGFLQTGGDSRFSREV